MYRTLVKICLFAAASAATPLAAQNSPEEVALLRQQVELLQSQLSQQQALIGQLQARVDQLAETPATTVATAAPAPQSPPESKPGLITKVATALKPTTSQESSRRLKVYGYIKLDSIYDTQENAGGNLQLYVLPRIDGQSNADFNTTARESRIGLQIDQDLPDDSHVTGKFEIDFYGLDADNKAAPRMRLAYADWQKDNWSLRFGQDWDSFIMVLPTTLNFATFGGHGALGFRRSQMRMQRAFDLGEGRKIITRTGYSRTIGQNLDNGFIDDGADSGHPTFQGLVAYEDHLLTDARPARMGISGLYGRENVPLGVTGEDRNFSAWSVITSVDMPFNSWLSFKGTAWTGANLDTYLGGILQGICVLDPADPMSWNTIKTRGGWGQLVATPGENWKFTAFYGLDNPRDNCLETGMRSKNELIGANVYYTFFSSLTVALELSRLQTTYLNGDNPSNYRLHNALIYKF